MVSPPTPGGVSPQMAPFGRNLGGEVIVVEDRVDLQGMWRVHLMSNSPTPSPSPIIPSHPTGTSGVIGEGSQWVREAGVYHLRMCVPFRGALDVMCEGWVKARRLVMWSLEGCPSVRFALHEAAREFERLFGGRAQFGFIRKMRAPLPPDTLKSAGAASPQYRCASIRGEWWRLGICFCWRRSGCWNGVWQLEEGQQSAVGWLVSE